MLFKYAFRKIDVNDPDLTAMQINLVVQTFWQISPIVMAFFIVWSIFNGSFAFITGIIISIIFWSTLPAFIYAKQYSHTESLWSYVYGAFSFITMAWVAPYSVLTVHKSGWMTRQTPEKKGPSAPPAYQNGRKRQRGWSPDSQRRHSRDAP